jgi:hypothetical protein
MLDARRSLFVRWRYWRGRQKCRLHGHDLPQVISDESHSDIVQLTHRPAGIGGACGIVRPITCPRCDVTIDPMDRGYPFVEYKGEAANVGPPPIELVAISYGEPLDEPDEEFDYTEGNLRYLREKYAIGFITLEELEEGRESVLNGGAINVPKARS